MENKKVDSPPAAWGTSSTWDVPKIGDLITGGFFELTLPQLEAEAGGTVGWIPAVGIYAFEEMSYEIGGNPYETHIPEYCDVWNRLKLPESKLRAFKEMTGQTLVYQVAGKEGTYTQTTHDSLQELESVKAPKKLLIPLMFTWSNDFGCAFPNAVLVFNDFKIKAKLRAFDRMYVLGAGSTLRQTVSKEPKLEMFLDFCYLNEQTRAEVASCKSFYMINEVQHREHQVNTDLPSLTLNFSKVVSELIFMFREAAAEEAGHFNHFDVRHPNPNQFPSET